MSSAKKARKSRDSTPAPETPNIPKRSRRTAGSPGSPSSSGSVQLPGKLQELLEVQDSLLLEETSSPCFVQYINLEEVHRSELLEEELENVGIILQMMPNGRLHYFALDGWVPLPSIVDPLPQIKRSKVFQFAVFSEFSGQVLVLRRREVERMCSSLVPLVLFLMEWTNVLHGRNGFFIS